MSSGANGDSSLLYVGLGLAAFLMALTFFFYVLRSGKFYQESRTSAIPDLLTAGSRNIDKQHKGVLHQGKTPSKMEKGGSTSTLNAEITASLKNSISSADKQPNSPAISTSASASNQHSPTKIGGLSDLSGVSYDPFADPSAIRPHSGIGFEAITKSQHKSGGGGGINRSASLSKFSNKLGGSKNNLSASNSSLNSKDQESPPLGTPPKKKSSLANVLDPSTSTSASAGDDQQQQQQKERKHGLGLLSGAGSELKRSGSTLLKGLYDSAHVGGYAHSPDTSDSSNASGKLKRTESVESFSLDGPALEFILPDKAAKILQKRMGFEEAAGVLNELPLEKAHAIYIKLSPAYSDSVYPFLKDGIATHK